MAKHRSKRPAVNSALAEYVDRRRRKRILRLFGKQPWDSSYDYKAERRRR